MDAKGFVREFRSTLLDEKHKGLETIQTENLITYLDTIVDDLGTPDEGMEDVRIERHKVQLQQTLEDHKHENERQIEMFKSVILAGQGALKTAFLMNGGSAAAILAFIGHLATRDGEKVPLLASSLVTFMIGVLIGGVASGVTYLSQWLYASDRPRPQLVGYWLNITAIVLGLASYVVFAFGVHTAYGVFSKF